VRLINSGRGIEAWLEGGPAAALIDSGGPGRPAQSANNKIDHNGGQLILSHGPLSYDYKLFKIELHSAPAGSQRLAAPAADENEADDGDDDDVNNNTIGAGDEIGAGQTHNSGRRGGDEPASGPRSPAAEGAPEALRAPMSSEHLINGRSFDAELQLHFYNLHLASSGQEALRLANEQPLASLFAVISVLISLPSRDQQQQRQQQQPDQTGRIDGDNKTAAGPLDFLLDHLHRLQNQGDVLELRLSRAQLDALLTDKRQYVTYQGSMNRPPCAESVDWIVLNRPLRVDERKFMQLFERTNTNQENIRPIKQLNNRLLRTTINNLRYKRAPASGRQQDHDDGRPAAEKCHKVSVVEAARP
jgi:hypothetical protein